MLKIGLTGGMGAGKTTIAKIFESMGVPVYYADTRAKDLMHNDEELKKNIIEMFGNQAYTKLGLNNKYIAKIVFNDKTKLKELEKLVHPAVIRDFNNWLKKQKAEYIIIENAILHKSGMDKLVDLIIFVQANDEIKIKRVQNRDKLNKNEIKQRLKNQENDETLLKKSDYIIANNGNKNELRKKITEIDKKVKFMLKKS